MTKRISRSRGPAGSGAARSRCGADRAHHVEVAARLPRADGVGGAGRGRCSSDADQRLGVILHEQPVARVGAVAVNRQRLALQRIQRDQRDQFLRKLPRAVIVAGVARRWSAARRCGSRRAPGDPTPPCWPNRGCAGRTAVVSVNGASSVPERAEHLVGRDVMEAERRPSAPAARPA